MKNKKGFAWFKTILFFVLIALFTILVIFIMQYIKNSNKDNLNVSKSNLKMVEPTEYNPINEIYSYNIMSYKNSNFQSNLDYETNIYNYETNNLIYYYVNGYYNFNNNPNTFVEGIANITSGYYPKAFNVNTNENKILIGRDLYEAHNTQYNWKEWNSVRSWAICYNCNIPINAFNFTMYYNFPINSSFSIYFYVYTDVGSMRFTNFTFNTTTLNHSLSGTSILSTLPSATKVLRFGFGFAQSTSTTNSVHYLPNSAGTSSATNGINYDSNQVYVNYFNTLTDVQKDNCLYMAFNTQSYPIEYLQGYDNGYNDALNNANTTINTLNTNILDLQNQVNNLTSTINNQNNIINNLQDQLNQQTSNFKGFFFTLADVPVRTVSNVLGFEVFGVNLFQFFIGALTALGCIWLIKKFL